MRAMTLPWDMQEARNALAASSANQNAAEVTLREAVKKAAACEQAYRIALASKIMELRASGPATLAADLARGDERVAHLRFNRDVAEGMKDAAVQVGWRASADRKDAQALAAWSMRRDLAEGYQPPQHDDPRFATGRRET